MAVTVYDRVTAVAKAMGYDVALNPTVPADSMVLGDVAELMLKAIREKWPNHTLPPKIPTIKTSSKTIRTRVYPAFMQETLDEIIRKFIEEKKPFDKAGNVVPYRPRVSEEEKRKRYLDKKLGAPTTETFGLYVPGTARPLMVSRRTRLPPPPTSADPSASAPPNIQSPAHYPRLQKGKSRRPPAAAASPKE